MAHDLIDDSEELVSAEIDHPNTSISIPIYDDGYGPLWICFRSLGHFAGITAIIRARTWEDAYQILEDEFFPGATVDEIISNFESNYRRETGDNSKSLDMETFWEWAMDSSIFNASVGFRNNPRREEDGSETTMYWEQDVSLEPLTVRYLKEDNIRINKRVVE